MFGGPQSILVLSMFIENFLIFFVQLMKINYFRPKYQKRIGPKSPAGEYKCRKGKWTKMSHCIGESFY